MYDNLIVEIDFGHKFKCNSVEFISNDSVRLKMGKGNFEDLYMQQINKISINKDDKCKFLDDLINTSLSLEALEYIKTNIKVDQQIFQSNKETFELTYGLSINVLNELYQFCDNEINRKLNKLNVENKINI